MSSIPDGVGVTRPVNRQRAKRTASGKGADTDASMSDQVYEALRGDILICSLAPGQAISEASLAARYGFGKAPIRAALSRLRQEGLVSASPRRSFIVSPLTLRDVRELYELRLLLEPAAARLAAGRVDMKQLAKLNTICLKGYTPGDAASTLRFLDANREFHLEIARASGNQRFLRLLHQVLDETTRVMFVGLGLRNRNEEMQHEHQALMAALQGGDGAAAERITVDQVTASRDMVLAALLNSSAMLDSRIGG
jgi:DNA-binding GntR family transcriptional regulator